MLSLQISLNDNEDSVSRTIEFDEDKTWLDIILACADVVSAKYGYDVLESIKFISDCTTWTDRGHDHVIRTETWKEFIGKKEVQDEFDFNKQDEDEEWS